MEMCNTTKLECGHCMPVCEHRREVISQAERQRILQDAIKHYGADHQADMAIEEMAELTKALLKMRRSGQADLAAVHEELVDVQIMLDQLRIIYGWDTTTVEAYKLARLQEAIQDAQKS